MPHCLASLAANVSRMQRWASGQNEECGPIPPLFPGLDHRAPQGVQWSFASSLCGTSTGTSHLRPSVGVVPSHGIAEEDHYLDREEANPFRRPRALSASSQGMGFTDDFTDVFYGKFCAGTAMLHPDNSGLSVGQCTKDGTNLLDEFDITDDLRDDFRHDDAGDH